MANSALAGVHALMGGTKVCTRKGNEGE